jgi:hypothetical protein
MSNFNPFKAISVTVSASFIRKMLIALAMASLISGLPVALAQDQTIAHDAGAARAGGDDQEFVLASKLALSTMGLELPVVQLETSNVILSR